MPVGWAREGAAEAGCPAAAKSFRWRPSSPRRRMADLQVALRSRLAGASRVGLRMRRIRLESTRLRCAAAASLQGVHRKTEAVKRGRRKIIAVSSGGRVADSGSAATKRRSRPKQESAGDDDNRML